MVAVNPPASEGNLDSMPPEDLLASVKRTGETGSGAGWGTDEQAEYARRQTGWWYLLLFALLACMAEIYIANRTYKTT
jgi:hypothetical protein